VSQIVGESQLAHFDLFGSFDELVGSLDDRAKGL
jgi:hypothetical protein